MNKSAQPAAAPFTAYQKLVILILTLTQFTVILDFMIMSPLGDLIMKHLSLKPAQFGTAVSAYAFSAGITGLLTAGFADRFDRKKLLLFFYAGFVIGTILCGVSTSYHMLLVARIVTGIFGGVIGSISMAIITDIFSLQQRGRVMGFVMMGFSASQVLGLPIGLYLASHMAWGWKAPFLMVALLALAIFVLIALRLRPVNKHLAMQQDRNPLLHLWHTLSNKNYRIGYSATALLSIGGFMMMPFGAAFAVNNLGLKQTDLTLLYMVGGLSSVVVMPLIGKLSDKIDKFTIFCAASIWMMIIVVLYTNLGRTPLWEAMLFNVLMMTGILSRMVPSGALTSAVPEMADRGAYMSINASLQQIAGGVAAQVAGWIVVKKTEYSPLEHYNTVGYIMVAISLVSMLMLYRVKLLIKPKTAQPPVAMEPAAS